LNIEIFTKLLLSRNYVITEVIIDLARAAKRSFNVFAKMRLSQTASKFSRIYREILFYFTKAPPKCTQLCFVSENNFLIQNFFIFAEMCAKAKVINFFLAPVMSVEYAYPDSVA
jgi:hypothetical protein